MDSDRARLAGLSHDLAREWEPERMKEYARRDGEGLSALEEENPLLLHGRAAAQLLREEFEVEDEELLHAVSHHTLGSKHPSRLDLLLYCADYVEPNRRFLDDQLRHLRETADLETLALAVVEHIRGRGHELADQTLAMAQELRRRMESA
jgi:nicotinate-nucleotide adenylyltransferase